MHAMLAIMTQNGWRPGFGDDDFEGWVITAAYFIAAALCAWAWRGELNLRTRDAHTARPLMWFLLAGVLVVLGFNKQLDFQHWLIFAVRERFSNDPSLWSMRYLIGGIVACLMTAAAAVAGIFAVRYVGPAWRRYALVFVGLTYLGVFIFARAGSFLPILSRINAKHMEAMHLLLELGSLIMIGIGAAQAIGYLTNRQRATRQDALVEAISMRMADAPTIAMPAAMEPAARQAA